MNNERKSFSEVYIATLFNEVDFRVRSYRSIQAEKRRIAAETLALPEHAQTLFLGWDLKKAPSNNWYVIEVNGRNSGLTGLAQVDEDFSLPSFFSKVEQRFGIVPHSDLITDEVAEEIFVGLAPKLELDPLSDVEQTALEKKFTFNNEELESALEDKRVHKELLPCDIVAPFIDSRIINRISKRRRPRFLEKLLGTISDNNADFDEYIIFLKNPNSRQGSGVTVMNRFWLSDIRLSSNLMVEPLVKSKPILNLKTSKLHDGCMRFGTVANVDSSGQVSFIHAGGYWRLAPRALGNRRALDYERLMANFSNVAISQKASKGEIAEAQEVVERATLNLLSNFYSRAFVTS